VNALAHALASGEAHAIETASVLGSVHAKIRKSEVEESREEKSREKYRYSPFTTSSSYVPRETRDDVVSATRRIEVAS
jgi:hypothetical protein